MRPPIGRTGIVLDGAFGIVTNVSPESERFVMFESGEESGAATGVNVLLN